MFLVTSPIVINVPTRGLLAAETMHAIVRWLANLNIKRKMTSMFVNKKHRYSLKTKIDGKDGKIPNNAGRWVTNNRELWSLRNEDGDGNENVIVTTNDVKVRKKKDGFAVIRSRSRENLKFGHFTFLFCRGRQRNVPKCKTHVQSDCFCSLSLLFCDVFVDVAVVVS